jgi:alpha-D-ribose 1-methylphosphonate 5-triphosphate synthase subunit PhnG
VTSRFSDASTLQAARTAWFKILVRVPADELIQASGLFSFPMTRLKAPEVGLMMTDGRVHATGQPFHLGEVSLTRCVLRDDSGCLGYGQILGRNRHQAEAIAMLDLALQRQDSCIKAEQLVATWSRGIEEVDALEADRVQQTAVEFFTMVRGEA